MPIAEREPREDFIVLVEVGIVRESRIREGEHQVRAEPAALGREVGIVLGVPAVVEQQLVAVLLRFDLGELEVLDDGPIEIAREQVAVAEREVREIREAPADENIGAGLARVEQVAVAALEAIAEVADAGDQEIALGPEQRRIDVLQPQLLRFALDGTAGGNARSRRELEPFAGAEQVLVSHAHAEQAGAVVGETDECLAEQRARLDHFDDQVRPAARRALLQEDPHRGEVRQRGQAELRVADLFLVDLAAGREIQIAQDVGARSGRVAAAFELFDHERCIARRRLSDGRRRVARREQDRNDQPGDALPQHGNTPRY